MSQAGILDIESSNPQIPTQFDADSGSAIPLANVLEILGTGGITTSASGNTVTVDGSGVVGGDVFGPASSTDNALVRWDGITGKLIQDSVAILNDIGELTGLTKLVVDNITVDGDTVATSGVNLILSGSGFATGSFGFNVILSGGTTTISQGVVFGAITTQTTDFTTTYNDHLILVDVTTGAAPITVQLVGSPIPGQTYVIKDSTGAAATYNITVSGTVSGKTIDGATTSVINVNYGSLTLIFNNSEWNVI
jgi:hypothetical protein